MKFARLAFVLFKVCKYEMENSLALWSYHKLSIVSQLLIVSNARNGLNAYSNLKDFCLLLPDWCLCRIDNERHFKNLPPQILLYNAMKQFYFLLIDNSKFRRNTA